MNHFWAQATLLATTDQNFDKFRQMGSELRNRTTEGSGDDLALVAIVATIVPLFVLALFMLVKMQEKAENLTSPKAVFRELCKAHALGRATRHLLLQLAARHELTDPGRLFLEPERFDTTALGPDWRDKSAALEVLRTQLFSRDRAAPPELTAAEKSPADKHRAKPTPRPTAAAAPTKKPLTFPGLPGATEAPSIESF